MQKKFYDVQSINVSEKLQKYNMSENGLWDHETKPHWIDGNRKL